MFQYKHFETLTTGIISNFTLSLILVKHPNSTSAYFITLTHVACNFSTFNYFDAALAARSCTEEENKCWKYNSKYLLHTSSFNSATLSDPCETVFLNDNVITLLWRNSLSENCIPNTWFFSLFSNSERSCVNWKNDSHSSLRNDQVMIDEQLF